MLIIGPCSIDENTAALAYNLNKNIPKGIDWYFKASIDKANRTKGNSYRGIGWKQGVKRLEDIKRRYNIKVTTDIHETTQLEDLDFLDMIQIPAFLCRQTDLLVKAAQRGHFLNIKKGQFISPDDIEHMVEKVAVYKKPIITERGSSFGYNYVVNDFGAFAEGCQDSSYISCFDASHSCNGRPERILSLVRAALAVGADAIFVEVYYDDKTPRSDPGGALPMSQVEELLCLMSS